MKKIYNTTLIENTDVYQFQDRITKSIDKSQKDGLEVEIQFSTCYNKFMFVYSALIIAYKNE